ncbi:MAG: hypothetical protein V4490_07840 [Pseudomonadota bacterium]
MNKDTRPTFCEMPTPYKEEPDFLSEHNEDVKTMIAQVTKAHDTRLAQTVEGVYPSTNELSNFLKLVAPDIWRLEKMSVRDQEDEPARRNKYLGAFIPFYCPDEEYQVLEPIV